MREPKFSRYSNFIDRAFAWMILLCIVSLIFQAGYHTRTLLNWYAQQKAAASQNVAVVVTGVTRAQIIEVNTNDFGFNTNNFGWMLVATNGAHAFITNLNLTNFNSLNLTNYSAVITNFEDWSRPPEPTYNGPVTLL